MLTSVSSSQNGGQIGSGLSSFLTALLIVFIALFPAIGITILFALGLLPGMVFTTGIAIWFALLVISLVILALISGAANKCCLRKSGMLAFGAAVWLFLQALLIIVLDGLFGGILAIIIVFFYALAFFIALLALIFWVHCMLRSCYCNN